MNLLPKKCNMQPQAEPSANGASPGTSCCLAEPTPKVILCAPTFPKLLLFLQLYPLHSDSFHGLIPEGDFCVRGRK